MSTILGMESGTERFEPQRKARRFVNEALCYGLLSRAGILPPRAGVVGGSLPFKHGERVVLKGLATELWHKSELGAVRFLDRPKGSGLAC